jgi:Potassium-transporting ATPase A subunit
MIVLYLMQRLQAYLPFNPQKFGAVSPAHVAFNTAASFTTNTNWQVYSGENTMTYFTQMAGLAFSQLRFCGDRNRTRDCVHPRHSSPANADDRQFLGRSGPQLPLGLVAVLCRGRPGSCFPRGHPEPEAV